MTCINNHGQIVGFDSSRATMFDPTKGGDNIELDALPCHMWSQEESFAQAINNNGDIVGSSRII